VTLHRSRKSGIFLGVIMSTDIHVLSYGLFNNITRPIFLYSGCLGYVARLTRLRAGVSERTEVFQHLLNTESN
jgi:hypothetical protein